MKIITSAKIIVEDLVSALKAGATLVYPTETCYGLGCDATNADAVEKVYTIKGRAREKSLIIIVADLAMMEPYVEITPMLKDIAKKYWPGVLTVIQSISSPSQGEARRGSLAHGVIASDNTIAFRVTSDPFARALVSAVGKPLVSTSANLAGHPSLYSFQEAEAMFGELSVKPDIVIDAGTLPRRQPSTIVRLRGEQIELVRQGDITVSL